MLNCVCIQGRLTRDPELKAVGPRNVCEFAIANNQIIGKSEDGEKREVVGFFEVRVWGPQASACAQFLSKGRMVNIAGELSQQRWEKDGKQNSRVVIVARNVVFIGGKKNDENEEKNQQDLPNQPDDV